MGHRISKDVCNIVYNYIHKYRHNKMMKELKYMTKDIADADTYYELLYPDQKYGIIRCVGCKHWAQIPWSDSAPEDNKYCEWCI